MQRRDWLAGVAAAPLLPGKGAAQGAQRKVLRVAFDFAETGFDPPRVSDQGSLRINAHIFESPLTYDHLARPVRLRPQTAAALPEVSADHRHFVFTLRQGILFADDPVFQGRPRELTAADHVYSLKRYYDPEVRSEHLYQFENVGILGLSELRRQALKDKTPFPYDTEVPGLRVLDRYRFELRLSEPAPRFVHLFASPVFTAAVAREVVEAYADDPMAHPVGTGPFRLVQWRRGSAIVLERNPRFREQVFDSEATDGDPALQALAQRLRGKRLPMLDRIEVSVIEEDQPRWLAFAGGDLDALALPSPFATLATPAGQLAPFLARQGVTMQRALQPAVNHSFFNFDDPMVGGYDPPAVALRRAIALAYDSALEIRLVLGGQAEPAQTMIPPHCFGHQPGLRSEMSQASIARANALLDLYGYADRNGDGWRERPDGSPLELRMATRPDQRARQTSELWKKRLSAVGLRIRFDVAPFGELIKRSLAGQLMMWGFTWGASNPDGDFFLGLAYGPNAEQSNDARFRLPAFDALYRRQRVMVDGPQRLALMHDASRLMLAQVPYIPHHHAYATDLKHRHVRAYIRHPFNGDWWRFVDVV
jgi:ABC-type transport system substrate-binding protein